MDTEGPNTQETEYGSSPWVDLGAFESPSSHHSPPLPEYHGFSYGSSPIMPLEPAYSMSIPPPYSTINLSMPAHPWPSMLTTHSPFPEASISPTTTPTLSIPGPVPIRPLHATPAPTAPTPRRTLTDEDRRRMCLYHEENKTAKQTDIGGESSKHGSEEKSRGRYTHLLTLLFNSIVWGGKKVNCKIFLPLPQKGIWPLIMNTNNLKVLYRKFFGKKRSISAWMTEADLLSSAAKAKCLTSKRLSPTGLGIISDRGWLWRTQWSKRKHISSLQPVPVRMESRRC